MGMITIKTQSAVSVPIPATNQLSIFVDSSDSILKTKDSLGVVRPSGVGTADELATTGAPVNIATSTPPVSGDMLVAINPTSAAWVTPPATTRLATTGAPVVISGSAPPTAGQIPVATSATVAIWSAPPAAARLATTGAPVVISGSTPPIAGQILTALTATTAAWSPYPRLTPTTLKTGTYNAGIGELVLVDVTTVAATINLPAGAVAGDQVGIKNFGVATNSITIVPNGADTIDAASSLVLSTNSEWAILIFAGGGLSWYQIG